MKLHHNSLENIPTAEDVVSTISPNTMKQQFRIGQDWIMVFVMSLQKYSVLL